MKSNFNNSTAISWLLEGKLRTTNKELYSIMDKMVQESHSQPGMIIYDWCLDEAQNTIHIYERYNDFSALKTHLDTWGKNALQLLSVMDITKVTAYGNVPPEIKELLGGISCMETIGGFDKYHEVANNVIQKL